MEPNDPQKQDLSKTCSDCGKEFASEEALAMHTQAKHATPEKSPIISPKGKKKLRNYGIGIVILVLIIGGMYYFAQRKTLPSTTMENHIEQRPPTQVLTNPLDPRIHRHLLEHITEDDGSRGGVVVNYDCQNYDCEVDLVSNLEALAEGNDFVYVAPFRNMKAKIVVTRLGRQMQLNKYNEERIKNFIGT